MELRRDREVSFLFFFFMNFSYRIGDGFCPCVSLFVNFSLVFALSIVRDWSLIWTMGLSSLD